MMPQRLHIEVKSVLYPYEPVSACVLTVTDLCSCRAVDTLNKHRDKEATGGSLLLLIFVVVQWIPTFKCCRWWKSALMRVTSSGILVRLTQQSKKPRYSKANILFQKLIFMKTSSGWLLVWEYKAEQIG